MKWKEFVTGFAVVGPIVLVVSLIVSYLYSLLTHGAGVVEWESSIRLGIILGIVVPLLRLVDKSRGT